MTPQPYKISVPQSKIDRLKAKLALAEFPDELPNSGWDMGAPLTDVKRLVKAWESYDWRKDEEKLNNTLPQFHTGIKVDGFDELDIHFVWQKSEVKNAIPLLFVHGCKCSSTRVSSVRRRRLMVKQGRDLSLKWKNSFPFSQPQEDQLFTSLLPPCPILASPQASRNVVSPLLNMQRHSINSCSNLGTRNMQRKVVTGDFMLRERWD